MSSISVEDVLNAYKNGYFPMAEPETGEIYWYSPDPRAIFPLGTLNSPRLIKQIIKHGIFNFKIDTVFGEVIEACARRDDSWISDEIIRLYRKLHEAGYAHSVEAWHEGELVGGLYGVSIGGAFFGESMFYKISNASKACFYVLCEHLKKRNFILLDSQFMNYFTQSLGAIEIPKRDYILTLKKALQLQVGFNDEIF
ncbi:MAG: Leucyl/phenylalanyl-tRNA--protein transferase [Ignavibacteria bacterium]|nr:Leucyl/phenylalanyl-tRNA--protein transferase [Ignavibacteria bacterium]